MDYMLNLKQLPPHWYVVGRGFQPGPKRAGEKGCLDRIRTFLDHMGFGSDYSSYSWRHTGALDLYDQHKDIYLVKNALKHKHVTTTELYLRQFRILDDDRLDDRLPM